MSRGARAAAAVAGFVLVGSVPFTGVASAAGPAGFGTCNLGGSSATGAVGCAGSEGGFVITPTGKVNCPLDRSFWVDPSFWGC